MFRVRVKVVKTHFGERDRITRFEVNDRVFARLIGATGKYFNRSFSAIDHYPADRQGVLPRLEVHHFIVAGLGFEDELVGALTAEQTIVAFATVDHEAEQSRKRPDRCDATGTATLANSPHSSSREGRSFHRLVEPYGVILVTLALRS